MRMLFFLVVVANVLLFFWETGYRHPPVTEASSKDLVLPGTTQSIVLIGESQPPPVRPASSLKTDTVPTPPASSLALPGNCLEIGPYPTSAQATELQQLMLPQAPGIRIIPRSEARNDSWWVLVPKAENMEVAKARRQMLLDKGIKDFWLFNKGELQGAISLGLHETREKAESAQRQFLEKGIVSEIVPRSSHNETYWVHIPWNRPPLALDEVLQTLRMQNSELRIPQPVSCPHDV